MPEVTEQDNVQSQVAEENNVPVKSKKGKGKSFMLIMIVVEILMVFSAYFVINNVLKPRIPKEYLPKEESKKEAKEPGAIMSIKDLVVNPAGSNGSRYLSASIGIEVDNEEIVKSLELRMPAIRDALIGILSSETVGQLSSADEKGILRDKIIEKLDQVLEPVKVRNVYFIAYVLQ